MLKWIGSQRFFEVSQNMRIWNRGFLLVESQKLRPLIGWEDMIKKFKAFTFSSEISAIPLISDCNFNNQTASPQSDCNLHNQTAIFSINEQILPCRTYRGPLSRVCQAPSALFKTAISAIRLQSQQSDCNLSNQTAISAIRIKHLATCLTPCWGPWHV